MPKSKKLPKKRPPKTREMLVKRLVEQNLLTPVWWYGKILSDLNFKLELGLTGAELDEFSAMIKSHENSDNSLGLVGIDISFGKSPQDDWDKAIKCLFSRVKEILGFDDCTSIFKSESIVIKLPMKQNKRVNFTDLGFQVGPLADLNGDHYWAGIATIWWLVFNVLVCGKLGLDIEDGIATGIAIQGISVHKHYIPYVFCNNKKLYITMVDPGDSKQIVLSPTTTKN